MVWLRRPCLLHNLLLLRGVLLLLAAATRPRRNIEEQRRRQLRRPTKPQPQLYIILPCLASAVWQRRRDPAVYCGAPAGPQPASWHQALHRHVVLGHVLPSILVRGLGMRRCRTASSPLLRAATATQMVMMVVRRLQQSALAVAPQRQSPRLGRAAHSRHVLHVPDLAAAGAAVAMAANGGLL